MELGTAKRVITPLKQVRLCGYATRTAPFEGVAEDIFVRVHAQKEAGYTYLFIYGDLLWWNSEFVRNVRPVLSSRYEILEENIWFTASHNHSGPATGSNFTPLLETYDEEYARWLASQVTEAVREALLDLEPVELICHEGESRLNVYRRLADEEEMIRMLPNYEVSADHHLTVLEYLRLDGSLKGTAIHYPCHANLSDGNVIQPDYPGVTLRMLDEAYPGSVSLFLQGCTADLRPNSVLGKRFVPCDYERVKLFAGEFFEDCRRVLISPGTEIAGTIKADKVTLDLPLKQDFTKEQVEQALSGEKEEVRQWAKKVLEKELRPFETMEISCVHYGDELTLVTFNGEISQYYAEFAREVKPRTICAAYTNGMIGYISTASQIREGGYEPEGSALYFALAGTYEEEIEKLIHEAMKELIDEEVRTW